MPYTFRLRRVKEIANEDALSSNKIIASDLILKFDEIHDLQKNADHFFMNSRIKEDDEYPDFHFALGAIIADRHIIIDFWQDSIYFDFGASHDPVDLFMILEKYCKEIIEYGFLIDDPKNDELLDLKPGLEANFKEYLDWCGLVDYVRKNY